MNEDPLFLDDYLSGNFFDFPMEDLEANDCGIDDLNNLNFQSLEPPPWPPFLSGLADEVTESNSISWNRAPQVKPQLTSTNTSSPRNFSLCNNSSDSQDLRLMHTSSPVSVLESSSSCSAEKPAIINPKLVFAVKRRRSNRRRPAIVNPLFVFPFVSSTSSTSEDYHPSTASQSGSEIHLAEKPAKKKQKRKKNLMMLSGSRVTKKPYIQQNGAPQKCMHCEVTETPQWREGPTGPKTLCNACGVRYRSGRLLPEYRPAASPTFVPSLHSNSHKKIMEMRDKGRQ